MRGRDPRAARSRAGSSQVLQQGPADVTEPRSRHDHVVHRRVEVPPRPPERTVAVQRIHAGQLVEAVHRLDPGFHGLPEFLGAVV